MQCIRSGMSLLLSIENLNPLFGFVLCVFLCLLSGSLNGFISCGVAEFVSAQRTMQSLVTQVTT